MSIKSTDRTAIIARWVFQETFNSDCVVSKDEAYLRYGQVLVEVASADGTLSPKEREWIIGYLAAMGTSDEVLEEVKNYQPQGLKGIIDAFQVEKGHTHAKYGLLSVIYDGFRAAAADNELHPKELEAIRTLAKGVGITEKQVDEIHKVFQDEQEIRRKRYSLLFPEGVDNAFNKIEGAY